MVETWHATLASEVATRTRELIDHQLQLEEQVEKRTADLSAALAATGGNKLAAARQVELFRDPPKSPERSVKSLSAKDTRIEPVVQAEMVGRRDENCDSASTYGISSSE